MRVEKQLRYIFTKRTKSFDDRGNKLKEVCVNMKRLTRTLIVELALDITLCRRVYPAKLYDVSNHYLLFERSTSEAERKMNNKTETYFCCV